MLARMRERGFDPTAAGNGGAPGAGGGRGRGTGPAPARAPRAADTPGASGPATIDALFAPLPRVESFGRLWTYVANQLQPVRLRLGISDGQNTELIEGDVKEGTEVVTNVTIAGQSTRPAASAFPGFGGPGGRQGFPGGGFQGGGRGGR